MISAVGGSVLIASMISDANSGGTPGGKLCFSCIGKSSDVEALFPISLV